MNLIKNLTLKNMKNKIFTRINILSVGIGMLFMAFTVNANANNVTVTSTIAWSAITGGSGTSGALTSSDNLTIGSKGHITVDIAAAAIGSIVNLGNVLLNEYLFPFEFASILFLSAMIGAVLLSKKDAVNA